MSDTKNDIYLSSSPHFTLGNTTKGIMALVIISLLPEVVYGTIIFGIKALTAVIVSVISCVVFEALFQKITKQKIAVNNLSAIVTGILLALVCPSTIPLWQLILGDAVAVVIAKGLFGGIGSNVFNPALTGRAFMFISFAGAMGASWYNPQIDAISSATTLSQIKAGTFVQDSSTYLTYFIGNRAGCIGETSILLILISFVFLLVTKVIDWRAPLAMIATVVACTFINGVICVHSAAEACNQVILALLTGGLVFGATFMVTDYATTPVTKKGRLVFGAGCGLITFLIRRFGGYPEGVMFSILIMNTIAPFLNYLTSRKYGYGKKGNKRPLSRKLEQVFDLNNAKTEEIK